MPRINKNTKRLLLVALGILVLIGAVKGVVEGLQEDIQATPQPLHSHEVYHTEWPGESGFLEWYRSEGISNPGEKAIKAGYATCSDLGLIGLDGTYSELRQVGTQEQSDQLLYASVHYLCPNFEPQYLEWRIGR